MLKNHRELYEQEKIKIYNASIFDFNKRVKDHCFVVGMEILDNMPHDRLYRNEEGKFDTQAEIII